MTDEPRTYAVAAPSINPPAPWGLTAAEVRVVQSLATGMRPRDMAESLGVSVHTIRTHLKRAMVKAKVHSQVELLARLYSSRQSLTER